MSSNDENADTGTEAAPGTPDAESVIQAFGGIRPMASQLGIAVSTVQGWKTRNAIPDNRWRDVIAAADSAGVDLSALSAGGSPVTRDTVEDQKEEENAETAVSESAIPVSGAEPVEAPEPKDDMPEPQPESKPESKPEPKPEPTASSAPTASVPVSVPPPPAKPSSKGLGLLTFLLALIAIMGVLSEPYWRPIAEPHVARVMAMIAPNLQPVSARQEPTIDPEALNAIADKAEALATRAGGMEERIGAVEAATAQLRDALDSLSATVQEADGSDNTDIAAEVAALKATLQAFSQPSGSGDDGTPRDNSAVLGQVAAIATDVATLRTELESLATVASEARAMAEASTTAAEAAAGGVAAAAETATLAQNSAREASDAASDAAAQIAALTARLGETNATFQSAIEDIRSTVASRPEIGGMAEAALMLTAGEVSTAVAAGRPYTGTADRLQALAEDFPEGSDGAVAASVLGAYAATGVASFESLTRAFHELAPEAHSRAIAPETEDGYWNQALAKISSLVSVRLAGDGPDSPAISRAEAAMARGDLASAVEILNGMQGADSGALSTWLVNAQARLEALAAARALEEEALSRYAGAAGIGENAGGSE